jgi:hypothetical protein
MSKLPTYEHGSFSRYKNDDGTTSCYRDGKFLGAFDNNSAFCDLFASLAVEIEKLKAELEVRNKLLKQAVPWVDRAYYSINSADERVKQIEQWRKEVEVVL